MQGKNRGSCSASIKTTNNTTTEYLKLSNIKQSSHEESRYQRAVLSLLKDAGYSIGNGRVKVDDKTGTLSVWDLRYRAWRSIGLYGAFSTFVAADDFLTDIENWATPT